MKLGLDWFFPKLRWLYRHSRRRILQFAKASRFPTAAMLRRNLGIKHTAPPVDTDPRTVQIYRALCDAISRVDGRQ